MNIKEMLNRMIDILKDKHTALVCVELPKIDIDTLRKKFFSSDEWRAELEAWKKEQEEIKKEILKKEPQ